jgi:hypothetical protein
MKRALEIKFNPPLPHLNSKKVIQLKQLLIIEYIMKKGKYAILSFHVISLLMALATLIVEFTVLEQTIDTESSRARLTI